MGKHWGRSAEAGQLVAASMLREFGKLSVSKTSLLSACLPQARAPYVPVGSGKGNYKTGTRWHAVGSFTWPGSVPREWPYCLESYHPIHYALQQLTRPPTWRAHDELLRYGVVLPCGIDDLYSFAQRRGYESMNDVIDMADNLAGRYRPAAPLGELHILLRLDTLPTSREMYREPPAYVGKYRR